MRESLPVIFRKARENGEITAIFPMLPYDRHGMLLTCYAHIGQHSGCSLEWYRTTQPASAAEYADLLRELTGVYHDVTLRVLQRMPSYSQRNRSN